MEGPHDSGKRPQAWPYLQQHTRCWVKRGDPLSPLLFGLFIGRLEGWLKERLPDCGVQLGEQLMQLLLYADDLTLLASSHQNLQSLLDCLHEFCLE